MQKKYDSQTTHSSCTIIPQPQPYATSAFEQCSLVDLEATRHQSLEHTMGIVLLCDLYQLLVVTRTVSGEHGLESSRVTHVVECIVQASLLSGIVDSIGGLLNPRCDNIIVGRSNPLDDLSVAEVNLGRIQTEGVTATSLRGRHPVVANWLPVQLNGGNVGRRDLSVQLGELAEEGSVDDADTLEELRVGGSLDGSGNEDIAMLR